MNKGQIIHMTESLQRKMINYHLGPQRKQLYYKIIIIILTRKVLSLQLNVEV